MDDIPRFISVSRNYGHHRLAAEDFKMRLALAWRYIKSMGCKLS